MMMVVTVMAVALHLDKSYGQTPGSVNKFVFKWTF
jgi:hypothetical protein